MVSDSSVVDTALARAVKDHLVFGDPQGDMLAHPPKLAFEALVDKRIEPAAAVAHKVVVVSVPVANRLVAHDAVTDLDSRHQLFLLELLEDAVDACPRHRPVGALERGADLDCGQRTALFSQKPDDGTTRTAATVAGGDQPLVRSLGPVLDVAHRIYRRTPARRDDPAAKVSR
jgi:hypothetical protein